MIALLAAAVRMWTPLALAALGGVLSERAGVVNLALEAMMIAGAFGAVSAGGGVVGMLAGMLAGMAVGLAHILITQKARVPGALSGIGLNLGLLGATTYGLRVRGGAGLETPHLVPAEATALLALAAVAVVATILQRTPAGLRIRACGESPGSVAAVGVGVFGVRLGALLGSGALAGLGGASLALVGLGEFTENMTAGRGYLALAAVILGRWHPVGAAAAALLFGAGDALQLWLRNAGARVPSDLLELLPYAVALAALALAKGRHGAPAALAEETR